MPWFLRDAAVRARWEQAVDLLVAATAELSTLTLVHYDGDFDQITNVTEQPAIWLAPAGSIS